MIKKRKILYLFTIFIISIFLVSCKNENTRKSGKIVYESDDKKILIYESELNYEFNKAIEDAGVNIKDLTEQKIKEMKLEIIRSIALTRALALEGKDRNIDKTKEYLDGIEYAKESLLASTTIADRVKNTEISEDKLRDVYEQNKEKFVRNEDTVRLQLVIINKNEKDKAEKALKAAIDNPDNFTEVVKKYSDSSDTSNGETGEIPVSVLEKEYSQINSEIVNVDSGDIVNKLIVIDNDIYIVKVLEKLKKGYIEFSKLRKQIELEIIEEEKEKRTQSFIKEVSSKYKLNEITLNKIKLTK